MKVEQDDRTSTARTPVIRQLGLTDYEPIWHEMQRFTERRNEHTRDEIWFVEHRPVFTLGMNASREHLLTTGEIPVVEIDRGGQVTYHGPGQLVVYPLLDLKRRQFGVRALVSALEQAVIATVAGYRIDAVSRRDAPGVYVNGAKLAAIGLRIRRGCSYHGLAFNINMDLEPFEHINPCGFQDLRVTQLSDLGGPGDVAEVAARLTPNLLDQLGYNPGSDCAAAP